MNSQPPKLSAQELQLIEQLRERPQLVERFQPILTITAYAQGPLISADEVEGFLIEEMRRLGNTTMGSWAGRAEQRPSAQLEQQDAAAEGLKKTLKWWCLFGVESVTEWMWRTAQQKHLRLLPKAIGVSARGRSIRLERARTDFGCEHSFAHEAARVQEHYGFEISDSARRWPKSWPRWQSISNRRAHRTSTPTCAMDTVI